MKTKAGVFGFMALMASSFVSAGPVEGFENLLLGLRDVIVILITFVSDVLLDMQSFDEFLLAKILLLIIIYLVSFSTLKKSKILGEDKRIIMILASAAAILAVRFLPDSFVEAIILQYNTFGIAVTVYLPLAIFFFFLYQSNVGPAARRLAWVLYGVTFSVLWGMRWNEIGEVPRYIYGVGMLFVILSLMFDRQIRRYFGMSNTRRLERMSQERQHRYWKREKAELDEDYYRRKIIDRDDYLKEKRYLEEKIRESAPR